MRSPLSSSSMSLLAPVRRVGVGGALLGCGTGSVLLERMTGLESLLAAAARQGRLTQTKVQRKAASCTTDCRPHVGTIHTKEQSSQPVRKSTPFITELHQVSRISALHEAVKTGN